MNSGLSLWLQQFCAIFLKRFYNSVRFWSAVICQFVLPLIFTILALLMGYLVNTLGSEENQDPLRTLSLQDTAPSKNISLFWAQFGSGPPNSFQLDVSILHSHTHTHTHTHTHSRGTEIRVKQVGQVEGETQWYSLHVIICM